MDNRKTKLLNLNWFYNDYIKQLDSNRKHIDEGDYLSLIIYR